MISRAARPNSSSPTPKRDLRRQNLAVILLAVREGTLTIITDEFVEKLLRENNIYPPSVLDGHYNDTAEMTRSEIILKTLREIGVLLPSGQYAKSSDDADFLSGVITELQSRLPPDTKIKTCAAFRHLSTGCCDSCHTEYPHSKMSLIDLPDSGIAWVCCAMNRAIYPERYAERMERFWNSPRGKLWREKFGDNDRRKD